MDFKLTKSEERAINEVFSPYLFYERKKNGDIECWCSRCNEHFIIPFFERCETNETWILKHQISHNKRIDCPHCKASVLAKQIGRAKECKNLWEEQRVVVVHRISENKVIAQSYYCYKKYYKGCYLPNVERDEFRRYILSPGKAECLEKGYYGDGYFKNNKPCEPFRTRNAMGYCADNGYTVIGLNELKNTFLRYHQLNSYMNIMAQMHHYGVLNISFMKYLCRFAEYPQLEILQKSGYYPIVTRMVESGIKTHPYVNWSANTLYGFFKMPKSEYKELRSVMRDYDISPQDIISVLEIRYALIKTKENASLRKAVELMKILGGLEILKNASLNLQKRSVPILKGIGYVLKQERCRFTERLTYYTDYIDIVKKYKLGNTDEVLFPPNLRAAHDRAVEIQDAFLEEERIKKEKELAKKYKRIYNKNILKYEFEKDGFKIIVPENSRQIIDEGKNMKHCVGGYAERHMKGTLTILFLRDIKQPDKSLYTIEMHGSRLTQVQGYNNRTPLTPKAKKFFNEWLSWVEKGSYRKKDGTPDIKVKPTAKTA